MESQSGRPGTRWSEGARGAVQRQRQSDLLAPCCYAKREVDVWGSGYGLIHRQGLPKYGEPLSNRGLGIGLMKITREWIKEHSTPKGGWTADQLKCLGVSWPPQHGWLQSLIGKEIDAETADKFEWFGSMRNPTGSSDTFAGAIQRLWVERKAVGSSKAKRLEFLLRWAAVKVAHKQEYQKRRRCTRKSWKKFMKAHCWVCHVAKATCRHHIIQVQHGGGNDDRNIVPLCDGCHAEVHPWMDASAHPIVMEARQLDAVSGI
jgi:hypothetical protein